MTKRDPLPLHEEIKRQKAVALSEYNKKIKQIEEIAEREEMYETAKILVSELRYLGYDSTFFVTYYSGIYINMQLRKNDYIKDAMNTIIDKMENAAQNTEYSIDLDDTKQTGAQYNIVYSIDQEYRTKITVEIYLATSKKCRGVKTQEMRTVSTYVCDEEK